MSAGESPAWHYQQTIPSEASVGSELVAGLVDAMVQRDWQPDQVFRVQLAYEEAVVNAVRHGNKFAEDKTIQIEMHCDEQEVRIVVEDMGEGFDPAGLPDPRDEERLEIPGGRGVMLIRELMSEVEYSERGNRVTMRKFRKDESTPPPDDD